jgi:outer membrane murein-binding lipoprotein Lpp
MIELLLAGAWKYVALGAAVLAALWAARKSGEHKNEAKHDKAKFESAMDQLEMHREADNIERDNAALTEAEARRKAGRVVQ